MGAKNIVEINGKIYDAHSGKLLSATKKLASKLSPIKPAEKTTPIAKPTPASSKNKLFIDGFKHGPKKTQTKPKQPAQQKRVHKPAPHLKKHATKSQTLHRRGRSAPVFETLSMAKPAVVQLNQSINQRLERAMKVGKSDVVNRFAKRNTADISSTSKKPEIKTMPTNNRAQSAKQTIKAPAAEAPAKKVASEPVKEKKVRKYKKHFSVAGIITSVVALVLIGGYLLYLSVPSISMSLASKQADFSASLPSYKPTGYSISGPASYETGQVLLNYKAEGSQKNFTLKQQPSKWDSQALKENYIDSKTKNEPLVYQNQGLTVYVYEGEASWVNNEKMFTLETKGSQLGVDQILKLASST